jgi:predicted RNase H-like HicB family nuclease
MKSQSDRPLSFYLGVRYPIQIREQEGGGFFATVPDLPGCIAQGESLGEALDALKENREAWIREAYESGREIPLPEDKRSFSGKFIVRLPRSLHAQLVQAADREGVSLNQYVLTILAAAAR